MDKGMTSFQISLLRNSLIKMQPIDEIVVALFYKRLFVIEPALRPAFNGDITEQGHLLKDTVSTVVGAAHDLPSIKKSLVQLMHIYAGCGVRTEHFVAMRAAWIGTLRGALGDDFTPEMQQAWLVLCSDVAELMRPMAPMAVTQRKLTDAKPRSGLTNFGDTLSRIGNIARKLFFAKLNTKLQWSRE
jgi:hemoglobin-like flavoprotein